MNDKLLYWASTIFGTVALLLLITNISLSHNNRILQSNAAVRAADINKGVGLSRLNEALVQALADAAIKNNDTAIHDLLSSQGITVKPTDKAATSTAVDTTKDVKKAKE